MLIQNFSVNLLPFLKTKIQANSLSFLFNVSDDVVPYFKTEPGLPQIHLEGNRLVLTCLAEGSWPLEFKWMHNDSELTTYTSEYK